MAQVAPKKDEKRPRMHSKMPSLIKNFRLFFRPPTLTMVVLQPVEPHGCLASFESSHNFLMGLCLVKIVAVPLSSEILAQKTLIYVLLI